jgi:hypothetical protein
MFRDIIEMQVARPPQSDGRALQLANEQFAYAYDIVDQDTYSLGVLAGRLMGSKTWYFWWD